MNLGLKLAFYVFILLGLGLSVYFLPTLVKVKEIKCSSQFGPCNINLQNKLQGIEGKNIRIAKKEVKAILTTEVIVKKYSLQFIIPDKLLINLIERKAKYALGSSSYAKLEIVDEEGLIISLEESSNLPTLKKEGELNNVGEKVSKEEYFALTLIDTLFDSFQIKEGKIEGDSLIINYNLVTKAIFPLEGDSELLASSFSLILKKYESSKSQPKVIDLRFNNPVISE